MSDSHREKENAPYFILILRFVENNVLWKLQVVEVGHIIKSQRDKNKQVCLTMQTSVYTCCLSCRGLESLLLDVENGY